MRRYLNSQKYSECQLVTALNAAVFMGLEGVEPDTTEYERLVDLIYARCGSAIMIEKAHDYLGIKRRHIKKENYNYENIKGLLEDGHPVEAHINHPKVGNHSCLIIDVCEVGRKVGRGVGSVRCVRVLNSKTTNNTWMLWSDLKKILMPVREIVGSYFYVSKFTRFKKTIPVEGYDVMIGTPPYEELKKNLKINRRKK